MSLQVYLAFVAACIALALLPGPVVTLVIANGLRHGTRAALTNIAGVQLGLAIVIGIVAIGLTSLMATMGYWFDRVRFAGAAYLVWLGIQSWRGAGGGEPVPPSDRIHFGRGFLVAFSNPKTIAFFTAFLPQFVDPSLPAARQLVVMCGVSVMLATVTDSGWAILAGLGRAWFMKPSCTKLLGRLSGLTLIGGGIWLSLARRPG